MDARDLGARKMSAPEGNGKSSIGVRRRRAARDRVCVEREPPRGVLAPGALSLALAIVLAILFLKFPPLRATVAAANGAVDAIAAATRAGTAFVFGYIGGGPLPFDPKRRARISCLAFQALPIVLVMSVLTTLLFYWNILPPIVRGFSFVLERTLKIGGAVGLSTAANIFIGMVEAPLFIRPYLAKLTRGELFMVMTGGMAGIAGTVLVLYATILKPRDPGRRRPSASSPRCWARRPRSSSAR